MFVKTLGRKITRARIDAFLQRHQTAPNVRVLDIGCSFAGYKKYFPNSVGVDIDPTKNPDIIGDAHALPFKESEFDTILCVEVFEHLHTPEQVVREMRRVLKPGGTLILTTRFVYPIHDSPHDYFRYTKYGLRHLFRDFEIVELAPETNTAESIAVLFQTLAQKTTLRGGKVSRGILLLCAFFVRRLSWLILEERASGVHGPRVVEDHIMSSGYHLVCRNTK